MEGGGGIIFPGTNGLQLSADNRRQEEEEAIQDQQRRHEEIQNILTNAFDDLHMDDDDGEDSDGSAISKHARLTPVYLANSVDEDHSNPAYLSGGGDSISNVSEHYKHCYRTSPGVYENFSDNEQYRQAGYNSTEQLKVLYEVRVREVERLTGEVEKWRRQATVHEADKERLQLSLTQQTNSLATSKGRINELEEEVATLKEKVTNLENSKRNVSRDLELYQAKAGDLQQRVTMLQRGIGPDPQTDILLRDVHEKHQKEIQHMQEQLEAASNKLVLKGSECENLSRKVMEISRSQDAILLEKVDTINRLSRSLEESQRQTQQLLGSDEVIQRYEATDLLDDDDTDSIIQMGFGGGRGLKGNAADINAKLRNELKRCITGHKLKRKEIARLQDQLDKEKQTIKSLQDDEARFLLQFNKLKEEDANLIKELKLHEDNEAKLKAVIGDLTQQITTLEGHIVELQQVIATADAEKERATNEVGSEYLRFHDQRLASMREERNEKLEIQVQYWRSQLDAALMENENVKKLYVEVCTAKDNAIAELNSVRLEKEAYVKKVADEIEKAKEEVRNSLATTGGGGGKSEEEGESVRLRGEVDRLESRAEELRQQVAELHSELRSEQAQRDRLATRIKEMEHANMVEKDKGTYKALEKMEGDIESEKQKLQAIFDQRMTDLTTQHIIEMKDQEERIKDEAVKFFTAEIDNLKGAHDDAVRKWQASESNLSEAIQKLVQMRKNAEKAITSLAEKLMDVQAERDATQKQLNEVKNKLNQFQISCKEEFYKMRDKYLKSYDKLKSKYASAKQKVTEYKEYVQCKEKHILAEWQRLDDGYRQAFEDIQNKLQKALGDGEEVGNQNSRLSGKYALKSDLGSD